MDACPVYSPIIKGKQIKSAATALEESEDESGNGSEENRESEEEECGNVETTSSSVLDELVGMMFRMHEDVKILRSVVASSEKENIVTRIAHLEKEMKNLEFLKEENKDGVRRTAHASLSELSRENGDVPQTIVEENNVLRQQIKFVHIQLANSQKINKRLERDAEEDVNDIKTLQDRLANSRVENRELSVQLSEVTEKIDLMNEAYSRKKMEYEDKISGLEKENVQLKKLNKTIPVKDLYGITQSAKTEQLMNNSRFYVASETEKNDKRCTKKRFKLNGRDKSNMAKSYGLMALWKEELREELTMEFHEELAMTFVAELPEEEVKQWKENLTQDFARALDKMYPEGWTEDGVAMYAE